MHKTRGRGDPDPYWGIDTQPQRLDAVFRWTPAGAGVLDLGCGRGAYVHALRGSGFRLVGADVHQYSEWLHQDCQPFIVCEASALPFRHKAFHTTLAFEVLEHCADPHAALFEIARCTSDQIIISVPNYDLDNALHRYDLAMAHWTDPSHCNFFTKDTLRILLSEKGFTILEMSDCYAISPNNYF